MKGKKRRGPYLAAGLICEKALTEPDGAISAIRIIDQFTVITGPEGIPKGEKAAIGFTILVVFKSGTEKGKHLLRIVMTRIDGKKQELSKMPLVFSEPEEGGANVKISVTLGVDKEGVYWFDIILDRKRFTRVPLRVFLRKQPSNAADDQGKTSGGKPKKGGPTRPTS